MNWRKHIEGLFPQVVDEPKQPKTIKFHKGTQITCPICHGVATTAINDVYHNIIPRSKDWENISPSSPMRSICHDFPYYIEGRVHTKNGWVSKT